MGSWGPKCCPERGDQSHSPIRLSPLSSSSCISPVTSLLSIPVSVRFCFSGHFFLCLSPHPHFSPSHCPIFPSPPPSFSLYPFFSCISPGLCKMERCEDHPPATAQLPQRLPPHGPKEREPGFRATSGGHLGPPPPSSLPLAFCLGGLGLRSRGTTATPIPGPSWYCLGGHLATPTPKCLRSVFIP